MQKQRYPRNYKSDTKLESSLTQNTVEQYFPFRLIVECFPINNVQKASYSPCCRYFPTRIFFFKPGDFLDNVVSFLAAMSSSRSDVVTQFVHLFVRPSVPFFSFSVLGVLSSPKEF